MARLLFGSFLFLWVCYLDAQSNFAFANPEFIKLLKGDFPKDSFKRGSNQSVTEALDIFKLKINPDSLHQHLQGIVSFKNRNTIFDDPNKPTEGIRGARKWIEENVFRWDVGDKAYAFPTEFSFDYTMCNRTRHTQLISIIPGTGDTRNELIIIEAHLDSRCEDPCDINCLAEGADDNGSGSALLMELARVLPHIQSNRTLVLIWTTGEEQGLGGARAFATYCKQQNIPIKAVFNNDIVGGIECGKTSSSPSCPGPGQIDSMRTKIFSSGNINSMHKGLARITKIINNTIIKDHIPGFPKIEIMLGEDRSGRGGDHIAFREQGYTAIRFTSAFEHGNGNPSTVNYQDRQHSTRDIIGVDTTGDGVIDKFNVNFNYLRMNTIMNAVGIYNASNGPSSNLELDLTSNNNILSIQIKNPNNSPKYVYGIRSINSADYDTVIMSDQANIDVTITKPSTYFIAVASMDKDGLTSMFSAEEDIRITVATENPENQVGIELLQNKPNPFDELTLIPIIVHDNTPIPQAELKIHNARGGLVRSIPVQLYTGFNEILYDFGLHGYSAGVYYYSLWVNNKKIDIKKMEFAN